MPSIPQARGPLTLLLTILCCFDTAFAALEQVDNTSSQIQYQGAWQMDSTPGDGDLEDTLAFSQDNLDRAIFQFTGTSVSVYGAFKPVGVWNMHSAYYLDDAPVVGFQPDTNVASEKHRVMFYSSGSLSSGPHTLTIVNMGQQFWFDYIAFDSSSPPTIPSPIIPPASQSTRPLTTSSSGSTRPTTSSNPPQSTSPAPSTSTPETPTSRSSAQSTAVLSTPTSSSTGTSTPPDSQGSTRTSGNSSATQTSGASSLPTTSTSAVVPSLSPPISIAASPPSPATIFSSASSSPTRAAAAASPRPTLSLGAIIGIATGGVAFLFVVALTLLWFWRRRRRQAARVTVSPFVSDFPDLENPSSGPLPSPPTYWASEKSNSVGSRTRHSLPIQIPPRQMLVIEHGDHRGGVWADYRSSIPSASGYHASESSGDVDLKAVRADLLRRARQSGAVRFVDDMPPRGVPF